MSPYKDPEKRREVVRKSVQKLRKKRGKLLMALETIMMEIRSGKKSFRIYVGDNIVFPDPEKLPPHVRSIIGIPAKIDPADYEIWTVTRQAAKDVDD